MSLTLHKLMALVQAYSLCLHHPLNDLCECVTSTIVLECMQMLPGRFIFCFFLRLLISFSHRQPSSRKLCVASRALTALPYPSSQCRRNPPWHEKKSREILRQRHRARRHHGWPREERFLRQLVLMLSPQRSTLSKEHKIDGRREGEAHSCFYLFSFNYFSLLSWRWRNGRAVSPSCSRSERWSSFDSLGCSRFVSWQFEFFTFPILRFSCSSLSLSLFSFSPLSGFLFSFSSTNCREN